jgi:hypothetical protein
MAEEVKKFTLFNSFDYERKNIKEILVRRLCVDTGYNRNTSETIIEYTKNLFGGVFKRIAQAEMVSNAISRSYGVYISPGLIGQVKTLDDLIKLIKGEYSEVYLNRKEYDEVLKFGPTPRIKKISKREIENRNWYGWYNSDYYEPGGNY